MDAVRRTVAVVVSSLLVVLSLGCDPSITELDPLTAWTGDALYACGMWQPDRPAAATVLADVYFAGEGHEPSTAQAGSVAAAGHVLHLFNATIVRAILPIDAIPGLVGNGSADHVRAVRDATTPPRARVTVEFGFAPDDRAAGMIHEAGGEVMHVMESRHAVYAEVPDDSLNALRAKEGVVRLLIEPTDCLR